MKLMIAEYGAMPPYDHVDTIGNVWNAEVDREGEPCHVPVGHVVLPSGLEVGDTVEVEDYK